MTIVIDFNFCYCSVFLSLFFHISCPQKLLIFFIFWVSFHIRLLMCAMCNNYYYIVLLFFEIPIECAAFAILNPNMVQVVKKMREQVINYIYLYDIDFDALSENSNVTGNFPDRLSPTHNNAEMPKYSWFLGDCHKHSLMTQHIKNLSNNIRNTQKIVEWEKRVTLIMGYIFKWIVSYEWLLIQW